MKLIKILSLLGIMANLMLSNLMTINAHLKNMKITPLFMIWDNQEQWNVIHHAPTAMQRAAAANFSHFCIKNTGINPITNGPHFCLGDALSRADWDFIRLCIDNAYVPDSKGTTGATFIWSREKVQKEVEAFVEKGFWHSAKWLSVLLSKGAALDNIAEISELDSLNGDVVVANYSLLNDEEKKKVDEYDRGRVIIAEYADLPCCKNSLTPDAPGWPRPLKFGDVSEKYINSVISTM